MPSRNVLKIDAPDTYYHVYARGHSKARIFHEASDYRAFQGIVARYLSIKPAKDRSGREYPHMRGSIALCAYCLMSNHFHFLVFQSKEGSLANLMRMILTSYSRYYNTKYGRSGPLFETRYKASMILSDTYLQHITRYIHLNHRDWRNYPYSSLPAFLGHNHAEWLQPEPILSLFDGATDYMQFLEEYTEHKQLMDDLKQELADS